MRKVIISVSGGVANIEAASKDVEVVIVEFDNLGEDGEKKLEEEMKESEAYENGKVVEIEGKKYKLTEI